MRRDFAINQKKSKEANYRTWLMVLVVILLTLSLIFLIIHFKSQPVALTTSHINSDLEPVQLEVAQVKTKIKSQDEKPSKKEGSVVTASVEDKKPRFEFYTILPEEKMAENTVPPVVEQTKTENKLKESSQTNKDTALVNTSNTSKEVTKDATKEMPKSTAERYLLQVASFRYSADAKKLVEELTQLGFKPNLKEATIQQTIWHRVTLGPYTSKDQAEKERTQLLKYQYKSLLLKLEDKA